MHDHRSNGEKDPTYCSRLSRSWSDRYGEKFKFHKVNEFPGGVAAPRRAHIYRRNGHFLVQWYSRELGHNVSQRISGDLVDALAVAREIDQKLQDGRGSKPTHSRLKHRALVERFTTDLRRRAEAGEIAVATATRYGSALQHYLDFVDRPHIGKQYKTAAQVNRQFALNFSAFIKDRKIAPNGHPASQKRKMRGQGFVLNAVRAMFEWAADPHRGNCLPDGFRSPFRLATLKRPRSQHDPAGEPDITVQMLLDFLNDADDYQLPLFSTLFLGGLRASEPRFLFHEHVRAGWLTVTGIPEIEYRTKGVRAKRVPILGELAGLLRLESSCDRRGLLFLRRSVVEGRESTPLFGCDLDSLIQEFERRCIQRGPKSAADRLKLRDAVIRDAGGVDYDRIDREFRQIARHLGWPPQATLKDLRHAFATGLANGGMPEHERRYLLGHAPGRDAINVYTHLNELREHYREAASGQWSEVLALIGCRSG